MSVSIKLKPLADYLLIEPAEKETTLPSGIVLPDTSKEKPQEGKVLAKGPGKKDEDGKTLDAKRAADSPVSSGGFSGWRLDFCYLRFYPHL